MATIRLLRSGQLTLPAQLRKALKLDKGTFLEAELEDNRIILTPKTLIDKGETKEKLFEIIDNIREKNKRFSPAEVEKDVAEAIKAIRAKKRKATKC